jgi:hypothetical protein
VPDELSSDPVRGRTLLVGLAVVVAAGAGILALRDGVWPAPAPAPAPSLSPYESPPPLPTESPVPPTALAYEDLCDVTTDGRTTLRVVFSLVNTAPAEVTLLGVTPFLPLRGLTATGTEVRGGSCAQPGGPLPRGVVASQGGAVVTMDFRLPAQCPKPYPVQARVRERSGGTVRTGEVTPLADLGRYEFRTCTD